MHADELLVTGVVTPHRIVDEVVNIISTVIKNNDVVDEYSAMKAYERIYDDVIVDELLEQGYLEDLSMENIEEVHVLYSELIDLYFEKLFQPLSFLLQQYGIGVVEQVRFVRFFNDSIVLEIGDEEESACRSVRRNGYDKGLF